MLFCVLDDDVNIGTAAKFRLRQLVSSGDVTSMKGTKFTDMLRRFMLTITQYLCNNLPFEDDLLHAARWLSLTGFSVVHVNVILDLACKYGFNFCCRFCMKVKEIYV